MQLDLKTRHCNCY